MGTEWILGEIGLGGCGLDSSSSGQGLVAGCCECGDEPSGSCATELVSTHKFSCKTSFRRIYKNVQKQVKVLFFLSLSL
jgi:hypothetical protein